MLELHATGTRGMGRVVLGVLNSFFLSLGDRQSRVSLLAVAEYQGKTSPRMRVRHFNIAGVAWSNFKPGMNTNWQRAISNNAVSNEILSIDVANMGGSVDEALVELYGGGWGGGVRGRRDV